MRRSYRSEKFLGILDRVREKIPHAAITTDIIVGFPGETEDDFEDTLSVVEQARFATAFTFQYSIREGTPAATMPDQVPKAVVQARYERLMARQNQISWEENQALIGTTVNLLVANDEGRKDDQTHRLSGRAEDGRLGHFSIPEGAATPRPGDVVSVTVTEAKPYFLLADPSSASDYLLRPTRAGDAWDRWQAESCGAPTPTPSGGPTPVRLGMPSLPVSGN
jgi:tRNA-2-methylthio-N6-dimethylallyladenosine synthase